MIEKQGYPAERYRVITKDDYILTLYRIPYSPKSPPAMGIRKVPVFLQNPMFGCSADYVVQGEGRAIALLLADAGYDVWLANSRSSKFSRQHKYLSATSPKFWQFDWHEIGIYDVPASVDLVLKHTGHKAVHFIGCSEGTTTFFVMAAVRPEYNAKIITMHALGPTAFMSHSKVPMIQMFRRPAFRSLMKILHEFAGNREFLPDWLVSTFCRPIQRQCSEWLTAGNGLNLAQHNDTLLPAVWMHSPGGSAFRQIEHYGQIVESGRFCWFDHGKEQNMKLYGRPTPPDYDLKKVTAPVYLYYSTGDHTAVIEVNGNFQERFFLTLNGFLIFSFTGR
jgi:lysosomal acid lipase/cholesteryl ester hydrolase